MRAGERGEWSKDDWVDQYGAGDMRLSLLRGGFE
jgi:hypothetical protein